MQIAYSMTSSIAFFILATIAYIMVKYAMSPDNPDAEGDKTWMVTMAYVFITLLAQLIANFSNAKAICDGSTQSFGLIFIYTLIPYFFILGTVMVLLTIFPGWGSPFANTIGYLIISAMGLSNTFKKLLEPPGNGNELLMHICSDKSLVVNEMTKYNYDDFMKSLSKTTSGGNILIPNYKTKEEDGVIFYEKLYKLIQLKNIVGAGIWYLLAGCLAISIANNVVIGIQCDYDAKAMKDISEKVKAQQAQMHADNENNKPALYTKHI